MWRYLAIVTLILILVSLPAGACRPKATPTPSTVATPAAGVTPVPAVTSVTAVTPTLQPAPIVTPTSASTPTPQATLNAETAAEVKMAYLVSYDSGDGVVNSSKFTLKVIEARVQKDSETCFHVVTAYDPYPERKVNAIIVGSTKVTFAGEEIWRDEGDLRVVHKRVMQINLPIVGTATTEITYTGYDGYPGWPYHLHDSWTYTVSYATDTFLQPKWTDTFRVDVVADDATVEIEGVVYRCFKVVHTLVSTTNHTPPGPGVGATYVEYWNRDGKSIGPVEVEDSFDFRGTETRIMTGAFRPLPF
jgi:hypothetical protein